MCAKRRRLLQLLGDQTTPQTIPSIAAVVHKYHISLLS